MASREELLAALRRNAPPEQARPDLSHLGVQYPDPVEQFVSVLTSVGGACLRVPDRAAADRALADLPVYREARRVVSLVPGVGPSAPLPGDPHALEGLDVAVLPGEFAVAENGAVWVDGPRLVFVVPEHLVLVVGTDRLVNDMHEAYAVLAAKAIGYGVFISGPSKTADIEQALVIGAQGARTCTVILVDQLISRQSH